MKSSKPNSRIATQRVTTLGSILLASMLLASCASGPAYTPAKVETRDVDADGNSGQYDDQATPLEQRDINTERAEYYQRLAERGDLEQRTDARLSAAEYYVQANEYQTAEEIIDGFNEPPRDQVQRDRFDVVLAYIAYSKQDYNGALAELQGILNRYNESIVDNSDGNSESESLSTQRVDALLLSSFCYQKLDDYDSAINALAKREAALGGTARAETTRYLWQVINSISRERRQLIIQNTDSLLVRNRLEQSLNGQFGAELTQPSQFNQWRQEQLSTDEKQLLDSYWGTSSPRSIAVLLPISSKFRTPAQAVMDGIKYQHQQNQSPNRPQLNFYDLGDNPYQAPQFYAAAVRNGADFVIGPLGKEYANQVNSYASSTTPTILLGGETPLSSSITRLTMSPEMEGLRVAERALRDGHLSAALLVPDNAKSDRTVSAFSQFWLQNGGKISSVVKYSAQQFDHSVELKQLFDINQSQYRYGRLRSTLGFRPKFTPYKRQDIDFIFMIANNDSGRIVRPQVNFFSGSKIPVYSTSDLFNGLQDNIRNKDLDNTRFPVMPWVLESREVAPYAGQLNMLFAMGSDAYTVAGQLNQLRNDSTKALDGNTGQLSVNASGEIMYQPIWATFKDGEAVTDAELSDGFAPINSSRSFDPRRRPSGRGTYNDQNWDPRESRRKTGS